MKKYLFIISLLLLMPLTVNADAKIDISSSNTTVNKNDTITVYVDISSDEPIGYYEYTLDYDESKIKLTSGDDYNVNKPNDSTTKKIKKSFKFKILDSTTNKISVKAYSIMDLSSKDMKVTINPVTLSSDKNNSNSSDKNKIYLSSLEVEGYKISPNFNKETNDYKLEINKNIKQINIIAKTLSKEAKIEGDGIVNVKPGENKFQISVRNQDGEKNIYNLSVVIKEGKNNEITFDEISFIVKMPKSIPDNYSKYIVIINEKEFECYKMESKSDYCLIYGTNKSTNDEGWYSYNQVENTIQKYNNDLEKFCDSRIKDTQVLIYILGGTSLLFGITVIAMACKLIQRKKKAY